jgi:hypothetical protein
MLVKIEKLQTKHSNGKKKDTPMAEEDDNVMEEPKHDEEEILLSSKQSGFLRDGPQYQPKSKTAPKTIECEFCDERFSFNNQLENHMNNHGKEGDWTCNDCSYQTNKKANLDKHLNITKHSSQNPKAKSKQENKFICGFCDGTFVAADDLNKHKITQKSFKPCKNLPHGQYENDCIFNHEKIETNRLICYECGETFITLKELMLHRKANHKMNECSKFIKNECKFTDSSCWYMHDKGKNKSEEHITGLDLLPKRKNSAKLLSHRVFGTLQRTWPLPQSFQTRQPGSR